MIDKINIIGEKVFYNPKPLIDYDMLIKKSLGPNTYRGFHKVDKAKPGSKDAFESVFLRNKTNIINTINQIVTENQLDEFEKNICDELFNELKKNIVKEQLTSFNKIRKPVDIVIEHLISMGKDFSVARNNLTKHLFLPLDSQMFQSEFVFNDSEIRLLQINRKYTFKDIKREDHYRIIQEFLKAKAKSIGIKCRIFFDLIWNERYNSKGLNLFETNPR